jgi:RNA polymerase sigma-70 factor, ECF subfamily
VSRHTGADEEFQRLADPYRRELLAHCYRMLGSVHDAEDLVQEVYVRAWRGYDRFEGRSSLRTWLHRIATTACLTALESRSRRPLPAGLGTPDARPEDELVERREIPWLEPIPDTSITGDAADPGTIVGTRTSLRLAFVAALQHLSPRQRAVLLLRDVLEWRAGEVAEHLGISTTAVNSALLRARAQLDQLAPVPDDIEEPALASQRALLDRYVTAFENKDIPALVDLFSSQVVWEMPPYTAWYRGRSPVGIHLRMRCEHGLRLVETRANGQPAFAVYQHRNGDYEFVNLQVLTLDRTGITHVVNFIDPRLGATFGPAPQRGPRHDPDRTR